MQKPSTNLRSDSARPCAQDAEWSVARAIVDPAAIEPELGSGRHSTKGERSLLALEAELERLQAVVEHRDQEIAELRARLSKHETTAIVAPHVQPALAPEQHQAIANPEPSFAATPTVEQQDPYPTLRRLAMVLESCSIVPPAGFTSQPPSQRRSPRRTFEVELEFTEDSQFYAGLTQDISQGGVFIATYKLLPIGRELQLNFDLPDGTHVSAKGEVRWVRESSLASVRPGMGIAFVDISAEALDAVTNFCRERPPLYMDL